MMFRISLLLIILTLILNTASFEVWPERVEDGRENFPKPTSWDDKNYGQWCRNRTAGRHVQCPMGSVIHLYVCCGDDGTACCFRIQPTVVAYGGGLIFIISVSVIFGLLLKFNVICPVHNDSDDDVESGEITKNRSR
ncbi:hypothetical protein AB6A40_001027 [Gnathostoma spinigerum]|uniref:Uncharacterized protein n=1 Tax=Gnathostoma spinigerum TaxID=75299 RepID=A0ABD6E398_9BILA